MLKKEFMIFIPVFLVMLTITSPTKTLVSANPSPIELDRMVVVCKLWGVIKYIHPYLAYKNIDWDKPLIEFLKTDFQAASNEDFCHQVQNMLSPLDDPVTKIINNPIHTKKSSQAPKIKLPLFTLDRDQLLTVTIKNAAGRSDFSVGSILVNNLVKKCSQAKGVIFDLRGSETISDFDDVLTGSRVYAQFFSGDVFTPCERYREHRGYYPDWRTGDVFSSSLKIEQPRRISGSYRERKKPIIFLANKNSPIPKIALALQTSGKAAIITEDTLDEANVVRTIDLPLTDLKNVRVRASELVNYDGSIGLKPDYIISKLNNRPRGDIALEKSKELLRNWGITRSRSRNTWTFPNKPKTNYYNKMTFPSLEFRILAIFKIWNIIEYFYPYKDLMDRDWEAVLREYIPKIINVKDATQYALTIYEMLNNIPDSHIGIQGTAVTNYFGVAMPPFLCRIIEGKVVITEILDNKIKDEGRILVGDIIVKVGGEDIFTRINSLKKYFPASTPQAKMHSILLYLFRGPNNSQLEISISRDSERILNVKLPRRISYVRKIHQIQKGEIIRSISEDIGYVDLTRLTIPMVDKMFETLKDKKAIIFDMRGYPKGTAWHIAPRLAKQKSVIGALIKFPIVTPARNRKNLSGFYFFNQFLPKSSKLKYTGKTVMLINERTYSQAEHSGLFFEAANNTTFIGSPSMGTNGNTSRFTIPGYLLVSFTGLGVAHADGRQLQQIGIKPHVYVKPTIKGIRNDRDEVLEKAISYLNKGMLRKKLIK